MVLPDGNDFASATVDKHARLESRRGAKLVLVGGSNLAFGLDSRMLEEGLDLPVVNMGMNAYLGLRFMLNEVRASLRSGDTVVLALEYETYFVPAPYDAIEGAGPDQLMMIKVRPESARYITSPRQAAGIASAVPLAAQQKVMRMLDEAVGEARGTEHTESLIDRIETRDGFNRYGDLVSHLGVDWPYAMEPGADLSGKRLNEAVLSHITGFIREMDERQVTVVIAPPPTPAPYYQRHRTDMEAIFRRLDIRGPDGTAADAARYAFPMDEFFDNFNHLTREGRARRTRFLVEDLHHALGSTGTQAAASGIPERVSGAD